MGILSNSVYTWFQMFQSRADPAVIFDCQPGRFLPPHFHLQRLQNSEAVFSQFWTLLSSLQLHASSSFGKCLQEETGCVFEVDGPSLRWTLFHSLLLLGYSVFQAAILRNLPHFQVLLDSANEPQKKMAFVHWGIMRFPNYPSRPI